MEKQNTPIDKKSLLPTGWNFWLVAIALVAGLILSMMSWLEICVEHCSANQDYRFLGFPFAHIGLIFFISGLLIHFFSIKYSWLSQLLSYMTALALGSEIVLIGIQKNEIGHWCPICISIAVTIGIIGLILTIDYFKNLSNIFNLNPRGQIMDVIKKGFTSLSLAVLGFILAFFGVSKFDHAQASMNDMQEKLAFGNLNSPIDVYFVTDWYCPSCKKIEPLIEKTLPLIQNKVKFYFVDYPIHKKSMNFTPYNLSFMINDKANYIRSRNALARLAEQTEDPNDEDIVALAKRDKLDFKELTFVQVKAGMEFFDKIVKKFSLSATPVLIIENTRTHEVIKLEGTNEIKDHKILEVINSMQKK